MSTHSVNVIEVASVLPHPNADRLDIVPVGGWQAVVKKGQFSVGDRAVYIEPDYTIPTAHPDFAFLAKEGRDRHRLKAVRLRGALSFGLLIPVPDNLADRAVGSCVMADLGIERYEPPAKDMRSGADDELPATECPKVYAPKFDIESLRNFPDILQAGEGVMVTEKIHGANGKYLFLDGAFYMGSRNRWLKPDVPHAWARASDGDPRIREWCEAHPGVVLYGEVFGAVQSLKYGAAPGEVRFAAFAASAGGDWIDTPTLFDEGALPVVPLVYRGPYDPDHILALAELDSLVDGAPAGHMREGLVIVPEVERRHLDVGRVAFKHISNRYWESAE